MFKTTGEIAVENLLSLETYSKLRAQHQKDIIALRKLRSVVIGEHLRVQFESEVTIRYQIQEMLRIEKIFEQEAIQSEIDAYSPLVPDGHNWKATMLLEYPDVSQRRLELARLIGIEDRLYVQVEGHDRVYAIADEDLVRESAEKTSSVHFVRFELSPPMVSAVKAGAGVMVGCDHSNYAAQVSVDLQTLASLAFDLH
jgi:Protein of unknown function (DUF3501)